MTLFTGGSPFERMPNIETERLLIRKVRSGDAQDMFEYSRDPEVARHVLWDVHLSVSDSRSYIRYLQRKYRAAEPSSWGIELKSTGKLIGTIGFMWWQPENSAAGVGYSLGRAHWNQGYMTGALIAVIHHGFSEMRLHRIEAQHETANPASGAVMEKAGMKKEGVLRGRLYNKGRYVDVALYAILRDDK